MSIYTVSPMWPRLIPLDIYTRFCHQNTKEPSDKAQQQQISLSSNLRSLEHFSYHSYKHEEVCQPPLPCVSQRVTYRYWEF